MNPSSFVSVRRLTLHRLADDTAAIQWFALIGPGMANCLLLLLLPKTTGGRTLHYLTPPTAIALTSGHHLNAYDGHSNALERTSPGVILSSSIISLRSDHNVAGSRQLCGPGSKAKR
jgi:hypothetical protein